MRVSIEGEVLTKLQLINQLKVVNFIYTKSINIPNS